ncbi:MAG: hypothetical protein A3G39_01180 [Deltaproteobacteria bacterium RIFCSPLOWO2_12_FULL_43_16]|nr:MAG: hypothetical protein A2Z89_02490 [Deltaproteobacteria bacterium GWA2_43_19]OGQ58136.1 MAG: hypothetical protein A3G39_01180 [Deltaproteobacteria bacterium RIFCSPLOWO2_12_FULL_43_16]
MKDIKLKTTLAAIVALFLLAACLPEQAAARCEAGRPTGRVVVAAEHGDYVTITEALAAICPDAAHPIVIDVMPGTYTENITMKDYMHLRGAGTGVTTLQSASATADVIVVDHLTHVTISGFTITGGGTGIHNIFSTPVIRENTITANAILGIMNEDSSPTITGNVVANNSGNAGIRNLNSSPVIDGNTIAGNRDGIFNAGSSPIIRNNTISGNHLSGINNSVSSPTIQGNTISNNQGVGIGNINSAPIITANTIIGNVSAGIYNLSSTPLITGNTITRNSFVGIRILSISSPMIVHNRITDNGGATPLDIEVELGSIPNISFNVYDSIIGTTGVGAYNLKSDGSPAPVT